MGFAKGCARWQDIGINLSAADVFKLIGPGNLGIASGEYVPLDCTGLTCSLYNSWMSTGWSIHVETGVAFGFTLQIPIVLGGVLLVIIALFTRQSKAILYIAVLTGVFVFGTMTLHSGGQGIIVLAIIVGGIVFVFWLFRNFSIMSSRGADGSGTRVIRANSPPPKRDKSDSINF